VVVKDEDDEAAGSRKGECKALGPLCIANYSLVECVGKNVLC
jgi:hypothetical protein